MRSLQIARNRYSAGVVAQTDVLQAQTQLANARADLATARQNRARFEHALAVLTGQAPSDFVVPRAPWVAEVPEVPPGVPSTLLQRRRSLPEINAKNKAMREFAERTAINTPIQGTAADIIKLAMLAVEKAFAVAAIPAVLLLQIHDELVFELPPESVAAAMPVVRQAMETAMVLDVPLVVNIEVTSSLAKNS